MDVLCRGYGAQTAECTEMIKKDDGGNTKNDLIARKYSNDMIIFFEKNTNNAIEFKFLKMFIRLYCKLKCENASLQKITCS